MKTSKKIVIIGGGTGIFPVVSAASELGYACSCIINSSDSGGSSGRIRDEFGFPPVGDLRQSLAALADPISQAEIRQLLLYRFEKGIGLKGHNLGNLILTALQDITGSTTSALQMAQKVFRIQGSVIPVSESAYNLVVEYENGQKIVGEHFLDEPNAPHDNIQRFSLQPIPILNPEVKKAIKSAQAIIIGPGDFYASLQSVLLVPGLKKIISQSHIPICYFCNIMTRASQTLNMNVSDHVKAIEKSIGRPISRIIVHQGELPAEVLEKYSKEQEHVVNFDLPNDQRVKLYPLATVATPNSSSDQTPRSLIRHNPAIVKIALKDFFANQ